MAEIAELLGKPLMPHQRYIADVALEIDSDTGLPAYHTVVLILPRQQGKTEFLLPLMTHRAIGFGRAQRILYTTQTASEARKKWEDIHVDRLQKSPLASLFDVRLRLNAEAMLWANGSSWSPGSTTAKTGGTGDTINLGVIDEGWSRPDNRTELGMRPAMLTQPDRQLWVCSMVPGLTRAKTVDSAYLRHWIRLGIRQVNAGSTSGVAFFMWAAPEGMDPADPTTWRTCMPAFCPDPVGGECRCSDEWRHTITEASIRADFEVTPLVDFNAEYLSWWPADRKPTWTLLRKETWDGLADPSSTIAGPLVLAVDVDPDRRSATIAAAGKRLDGHWHVEVIEPGQDIAPGTAGMEWVEDRLVELHETHEPLTVVIDPKSPAASLIVPLRNNRGIEVLTPNGSEIAGACARFYDATGERPDGEPADDEEPRSSVRVRHLGQPELDVALAGARKLISPTYGTFSWVRVGSGANISALYAVTLAMHGYEVLAPEDYDVLGSVPGVDGQCSFCDAYPIDGAPVMHYDDCDRPEGRVNA